VSLKQRISTIVLFVMVSLSVNICYGSTGDVNNDHEVNLSDLEAYWPFDDDTLDHSYRGHDASAFHNPGYTTGKLGNALDLNGPDDQYLEAANPKMITVPWTVSVWINKQGEPQSYGVSGLLDGRTDDATTDWYGLRTEQYKSNGPPSKVGMTNYVTNTNQYWEYSLPTGDWAHLVFIGRETGTELYVDGAAMGELTDPEDSIPVWIDRIGKTYQYGCPMDAYLDDLAIWSRVLSANEIAHLYNNGNGNPVIDVTTIPDTFPPSPNPATFAIDPTASSLTEITMMATTGSDLSGLAGRLSTTLLKSVAIPAERAAAG